MYMSSFGSQGLKYDENVVRSHKHFLLKKDVSCEMLVIEINTGQLYWSIRKISVNVNGMIPLILHYIAYSQTERIPLSLDHLDMACYDSGIKGKHSQSR